MRVSYIGTALFGFPLQRILGTGRHREEPLVIRKACSPSFLRRYLQEVPSTLLKGDQLVGGYAVTRRTGDEMQRRQAGDGVLEVGGHLALQLPADGDVAHQGGHGHSDAHGYADKDADAAAKTDLAQPGQRGATPAATAT